MEWVDYFLLSKRISLKTRHTQVQKKYLRKTPKKEKRERERERDKKKKKSHHMQLSIEKGYGKIRPLVSPPSCHCLQSSSHFSLQMQHIKQNGIIFNKGSL
jgi:hypothetical protein